MSTPQEPQDPRQQSHDTPQIGPGDRQPPSPLPQPQPQPLPLPLPQPLPPVTPTPAQSAQQYTASAPTQPGQFYIQPISPRPDWSALADEYEAQQRRKKIRRIVAAVAAVLVLGGGAAVFAVTGMGVGDKKQAADKNGAGTPSSQASSPEASPSPTLHGSDVFTATSLEAGGQTLTRTATAHAIPCWKVTQGGLGPLLDECSNAVLATYASDKTSVTVGVMVFADAAKANAANAAFKGAVKPTPAKGGPAFCKQVECAVTHSVSGRYLYTTIAGPNNGKAGAKDANAIVAGHKVEAYTLTRLSELD